VSVAIARQTKLKLGIVSVAIARQTKLKLGHGWIPNTNLALVAEAEQPSPVFEPRDIGHTARVPLQLEHYNPQRHIDNMYVAVLAATREEAATRRPVKPVAEV
jgi:hypothetical protein